MENFLFFKRRRTYVCVVLFLILFFSQSCQLQDETHPSFNSISINSTIDNAFLDTTLVHGEWIKENWWEMFCDTQLTNMIEKAIENNPNLQMAVERVSLAHNMAKQKFSTLLPSAEATVEEFLAGFNWNRRGLDSDISILPDNIVPKWINVLSSMINLRWSIDLWGKQRKLYQAAVDEAQMQMAEASYAKLMLSSQLAHSYFNWQYYLSIYEQQKEILNAKTQILNLQNALYEHGLFEEIPLQQCEKEILEIQNESLVSQKQIQLCEHEMKMLMGLSADAPISMQVPTSSFSFSFPFPSSIPISLLSRRADVTAKIWAVEAASKKVKSAKLAFLPSIDLGSFSGYLNLCWDSLIKPRGWFSSIAPAATLPIFKGLDLHHKLQYNVKRYNLAILEYNSTLLSAVKDVVDGITTFRISNEQLLKQEDVISKSQNIAELESLRYESGLNTLLDVLKAKLTLLQDEMNFTQYNRLHMLATLNLIKSLGGGYHTQNLEEVLVDE